MVRHYKVFEKKANPYGRVYCRILLEQNVYTPRGITVRESYEGKDKILQVLVPVLHPLQTTYRI